MVFVEPLWVLQRRESHRDSTSRSCSFKDVEFPLESKGHPSRLSIDSAVGHFAQPRGSTTRKERAALREQNLLLKETKKGSALITTIDFMSS
jgi:hypothetical protein